jgi:hypothetical protein
MNIILATDGVGEMHTHTETRKALLCKVTNATTLLKHTQSQTRND